jgi:hypothetical protein
MATEKHRQHQHQLTQPYNALLLQFAPPKTHNANTPHLQCCMVNKWPMSLL